MRRQSKVWCQESGKHERVLQSNWTAAQAPLAAVLQTRLVISNAHLQADLFRYQKQIVVRRFATLVD